MNKPAIQRIIGSDGLMPNDHQAVLLFCHRSASIMSPNHGLRAVELCTWHICSHARRFKSATCPLGLIVRNCNSASYLYPSAAHALASYATYAFSISRSSSYGLNAAILITAFFPQRGPCAGLDWGSCPSCSPKSTRSNFQFE